MTKSDVFISYASEDKQFVTELVGGLKSHGVNVWYDDFELKVGDKLLEKIDLGLNNSKYGILFVSKNYLKKGWTKYEMDRLVRQHIETDKTIFPLWHGVEKSDIETYSPSLGGIVGIKTIIGMSNITKKLIERIYPGVSTFVIVPAYENPIFKFFQGRGELTLKKNGAAFSLWEAIIHFRDEDYPLGIDGKLYTKNELLSYAFEILIGGYDPTTIYKIELIKKSLKDAGYPI